MSYEAFFRVVEGGHWEKVGSGRTYVPAGVYGLLPCQMVSGQS
ncbi:hypothetical protein ABZY57_05870 [Streptomyces sp. NPDC006450]